MGLKYIRVGVLLWILGVLGVVLNRKNLIIMLMSIELMLLAVSLLFLKISLSLDNIIGQIFTMKILTVAAAESAIGLAIFVAYYRIRGTIAVSSLNLLKG
uniref:NADH-ubiquinone oxidoreductase chain 4L n=1 Tax=Crella elegans TaxID=252961 RepID=A0A0H4KD76_CREEL|nr:NADH dehydrogenase subunit 4L [Crella elegans]AKO90225.1 NADH dehydrogenase subunit 4L [Crella elegans]